jgi:Ca-activated chloride channel family protein
MWESRARALGCWPVADTDCTWAKVRDLAASPNGWGMFGHPEWGDFHFGYAYVGESDVGTQTAALLCMMGIGKTESLTVGDVSSTNGCGQAIADVEDVIAHRGTSSPLILAAMQSGGPAFLDAVTTYEKNVIGFNRQNPNNPWGKLVAVYPQDGTVVADHTFAIMDSAPWVSDEEVKAAVKFREYLLTSRQQELLVGYGLRPADASIDLMSPVNTVYGANPATILTTLEVPDVLVLDRIVEVWSDVKKPANVALVFDKSGSMQGKKIGQAINGAVKFVGEMFPEDWLAWAPFDNQLYGSVRGLNSEVGEQLQIDIRSTTARNGTALYDAIVRAYEILESRQDSAGDTGRYGMVVLSDGQDTNSETSLAMLEQMLAPTEGESALVQIHTVGVGNDADDQVLSKIASFGNGRYWKVKDPDTLEAVYSRISKYW